MNGIKRIEEHFQKGKSLVGYLTVGDGGVQSSLVAARALIEGGITMLELGVPFSDPIADGPVITRAASRALTAGTTLQDVLWLATEIRKQSDIPLILFSYLNPILAVSKTTFFENARMAGIDGLLLVDCPLEEASYFQKQCLAHQIAPIYVITPSTSIARMQHIEQYGKGFLYYACRKGTTGVQAQLPLTFAEDIKRIKASVHLPVVAGFGIATAKDVQIVLDCADGAVMGSLFVKALEDGMQPAELIALVKSINPKEKT